MLTLLRGIVKQVVAALGEGQRCQKIPEAAVVWYLTWKRL